MIRIAVAFAFMIFFLPSLPAMAMEIVPSNWRGHEVLLASGPIGPGDAARLEAALESAAPLAHGANVLLLDSPGGRIDEALEISQIVQSFGVHTVIPKGARCGSACASIVFIAGKYRTVESGGIFGQHSCAKNGVAHPVCNEIIAQHALRNGVSHGSVAAFVTTVEPEDMLWWEREDVDCWGVSRYPFSEKGAFEKSEPCAVDHYFGEMPGAQPAWRVDFLEEGFRAFLRPGYDHKRDGELSLFCKSDRPGQLFISMDIMGPDFAISSAITAARVILDDRPLERLPYTVTQEDKRYSRVTVTLPHDETLEILQGANRVALFFSVRQPHDPVWVQTRLSGSRDALNFAADNCVNR